jgi:hypothetical protein
VATQLLQRRTLIDQRAENAGELDRQAPVSAAREKGLECG